MKRIILKLFVLCFVLLLPATSFADIIADTGEPSPNMNGGLTLTVEYYRAGQFLLMEETVITDIYGWLGNGQGSGYGPGNITIAIYDNIENIPGNEKFSHDLYVPPTDQNAWHGISNLSWTLPAGEYWVSFEVRADDGQNFNGYMQDTDIPNPLTNYLAYDNGYLSPTHGQWIDDNFTKFAVIIDGDILLPDQDGDGIPDSEDNCPKAANAEQADVDFDGIGDVCDNCQSISNSDQFDLDSDGFGNICDVCPDIADDQSDSDSDGWGDACDSCLADANKVIPGICGCGVLDYDSDNDGVADCNDQCSLDPNKVDPGQCGCGVPDTDSDSDGIADCIDACPFDGLNDADNDTICGDVDNCPDTANTDQLDLDSDGIGDVCDPDADNDGFSVDDCNDLDDTINPAQCDIKDDGIDQNCDGADRTKGKPCSSDDGGTDPPPTTEPEGKGKTCSDGIDNDDDGFTDCDDSGCARSKSCK